jgi:hypothetical protein
VALLDPAQSGIGQVELEHVFRREQSVQCQNEIEHPTLNKQSVGQDQT